MNNSRIQSGVRRRIGLGCVLLLLIQIGLAPAARTTLAGAAAPAELTAHDWTAIQQALPLSAQAYLKASNTETNDLFGEALALDGNTLVIGAVSEASAATGVNGDQTNNTAFAAGAVYVLVRSGTTWSQQAYLKASNTQGEDRFGQSVAISGDTIVVGAPSEDSAATGINGNQQDNSAAFAGAVYVFERTSPAGSPIWSQQAYLKASNTGANDWFGNSVAIDGTTIVVSGHGENSAATGINGNQQDNSADDAGAVYVFERTSPAGSPIWSQQAYLKASNTGANDWFGHSVDVAGDTIVVGAPSEDSAATGINGNQADNSAEEAGAAYVFERSSPAGTSTWTQHAYLKASNTEDGAHFGWSTAISGNTIVTGAWGASNAATAITNGHTATRALETGAAYVFVRTGTQATPIWSQQAHLTAFNSQQGDFFGFSVMIDSDMIVVGDFTEDSAATGVNGNQQDNSADGSGSAYVWVRNDTQTGPTWSQHAYLKAFNTESEDSFGLSVAMDGTTIVVGAPDEDSAATGVNGNQADNSASQSGAIYVFGQAPYSLYVPLALK